MKRLPGWATAGVVFTLHLGVAFAQATVDSNRAESEALAEALFLEGKSLGEKGQLEQACLKFEASQHLDPALGTLLHLATCYAEQGRTSSAWSSFGNASDLAQKKGDKLREALARRRVIELEQKLSLVNIVVGKSEEIVAISLDGRPLMLAATGTPLPLDPGPHRLEVTARGRQTWTHDFLVDTGPIVQTVTIPKLEPERAAVVAPSKTKEPERASSNSHVAGIALVGIGTAGMLVGSYFGLRAYQRANDAEQYCRDSICTQNGLDRYDASERFAWYSNAAFGVGVLGLASGFYLLLTSPETPSRKTSLYLDGGLGQLRLKGQF